MLVGALFDAWDELDWALSELPSEDLLEPWEGGSAFAWTYGHVANSFDAWINVRFQGLQPHPVIGDHNLRFGASGRVPDWLAIHRGVQEVRETARRYLHGLTEPDLDLVIPYDGSYAPARQHGLSLRFAVLIHVNHHHYHIGEIATKRDRLGRRVGDFPHPHAAMLATLEGR
jgi:hypothetical protein